MSRFPDRSETKVCDRCGEDLYLGHFTRDRANRYSEVCRACRVETKVPELVITTPNGVEGVLKEVEDADGVVTRVKLAFGPNHQQWAPVGQDPPFRLPFVATKDASTAG